MSGDADHPADPEPLPLNGTDQTDTTTSAPSNTESDDKASSETAARLDAMVKERDSLRNELEELRKSLESMQEKHDKETDALKTRAQQDKSAKDNAEIDQLRKSLDTMQQSHKQELDTLKEQAQEAQTAKDNAQVTELRQSIKSMQEKHNQELQDLKEQAQQAQTAKENAEVAELRKSLESLQDKHDREVTDLKKQAQDAQTAKDNTEITELRKSLESLQEKHQKEVEELQGQARGAQSEQQGSGADKEELEQLRKQLQQTQLGKENAESAYRTLLGKVNTIKSQLGERLKADAEELSKARAEIEELHEESRSARESRGELQSTIEKLRAEANSKDDEIESLRNRSNLSQSNWVMERDELVNREAYAREEFENARQAMQDWEVLAMEERSLRENLSDRVLELEEQLNAQKEAYERAASERDTQNSTVDSLQRALQDIQDGNTATQLCKHANIPLISYSTQKGAPRNGRKLPSPTRRPTLPSRRSQSILHGLGSRARKDAKRTGACPAL